ncbi:MAG: cytochrome c biogenesis protein CcsA [Acidimicrobiales bacterium]
MTTTDIPASTSSKLTRRIGFAALVSMAIFLAMALVISPPEVSQRDAVRLFYLHVPTATIAFYFAPGIVALGSVMYLWKKSTFWDLAAGAAGELAVLFCAFTLATGMLWGKPTWGLYWTWEPRLTATAVSFVLFVGYLAVRKLDLDPVIRSQRAAVLGRRRQHPAGALLGPDLEGRPPRDHHLAARHADHRCDVSRPWSVRLVHAGLRLARSTGSGRLARASVAARLDRRDQSMASTVGGVESARISRTTFGSPAEGA